MEKKIKIGPIGLVIAFALVGGVFIWNVLKPPETAPTSTEERVARRVPATSFSQIWQSDKQDIVLGNLHLELKVIDKAHFIVKVNDNEYNEEDYLVVVFDQNQNGVIDLGGVDKPYGLWANNMTAPSSLSKSGRLAFAEIRPEPGPHKCVFDPSEGYTFDIVINLTDAADVDSIFLQVGFVDKDVPYEKIGVVKTDFTFSRTSVRRVRIDKLINIE
jgi:hypothetical protein